MLKPKVWIKRPSFEHIKNEKLSMKMIFFSKKTVIFIISDLFLSIKWKFPKSGKSLSRTRLRRARLNHGEPFNIITVLITARPFSHSSRGFLYKNMHFLAPCQKIFLLMLLLKRKWESTRKMTTELFNRNNDKL